MVIFLFLLKAITDVEMKIDPWVMDEGNTNVIQSKICLHRIVVGVHDPWQFILTYIFIARIIGSTHNTL